MPVRARWALFFTIVVVVVAIVLSHHGDDVRGEQVAASCRLADRLRDVGQPDEAAKLYRRVLASPEARSRPHEQGCAADGLRLLAGAQCAEARRLAAAGLASEAKSAFGVLLSTTTGPADPVNHDCAITGLVALAKPVQPAPATPLVVPPPSPPASSPAAATPAGAGTSATTTPPAAGGNPTTPGLGRPSALTLVRDGARRVARFVLRFLTRRDVDVKGGEWAALALLAIVLALVVVACRRQCKLGSLDVGEFINATSDELLPAELVARMTDHLTELGALPPAAAPGGPTGTTALDVLGTVPNAQVAWLAKVGLFLMRVVAPPPPAGKLTGTVRKEGLTVELSIAGRLPVVRTFRAPHDLAARSAAGFAFAVFVHDRDRRCTSTWARWTSRDGSSVGHYIAGLENEAAAALEDDPGAVFKHRQTATDEYEAAAAAEPENLEVRLRRASLLELMGERASALEVYLEQVEWMEIRGQPHVFQPSYRFAIALTFASSPPEAGSGSPRLLVEDLKKMRPVLDRLRSRKIHVPLCYNKDAWIRVLLDGAVGELRTLKHRTLAGPAMCAWLGSFRPSRRPYGRRRELFELARPLSRRRRRRHNVVAMALLCAKLNRKNLVVKGRRGKESPGSRLPKDWRIRLLLAPPRAKNWQLRYNAACCYSRLLPLTDGHERDRFYCKAMKQLDAAFREADGDLDLDWIDGDPDLEPLRRPKTGARPDLDFKIWADRRRPPPPTNPPPDPAAQSSRHNGWPRARRFAWIARAALRGWMSWAADDAKGRHEGDDRSGDEKR